MEKRGERLLGLHYLKEKAPIKLMLTGASFMN